MTTASRGQTPTGAWRGVLREKASPDGWEEATQSASGSQVPSLCSSSCASTTWMPWVDLKYPRRVYLPSLGPASNDIVPVLTFAPAVWPRTSREEVATWTRVEKTVLAFPPGGANE